MPQTSHYDHRKKAGNEGDICKHSALIAALDETIARTEHNPFRYADIFAGYAKNALLEGNEWSNGIGKIAGEHLLKGNRHVALWATWSGLEQTPRVGGVYPGSAWFAMQVCKRREKTVELSLWDISAEAFKDLKATFPKGHSVNRAPRPSEPAITRADFVFIDPPNKEKSAWAKIREHLRHLRPKQSVLIWLPIAANATQTPPVEDGMSDQCRKDFFGDLTKPDEVQDGMGAITVRWAKGGHTIGCQLLYRVNAKARRALMEAVEEIVGIARARRGTSSKWGYDPVHYDP